MGYFALLCILCFFLGVFLQKLIDSAPSKYDANLHIVKYEDQYNLFLELNKEPDKLMNNQSIKVKIVRK